MADGALTAFTARIRPFYDRLDIEIEWLFYLQPSPKEFVPTTVFVPRWWEHREHWLPPGVGTVPGSERPYFGRIPAPDFAPFMGEPDWWLNGLSYARYLAGGYPEAPCWVVRKPDKMLRMRSAQTFRVPHPNGLWALQAQQVLVPQYGTVLRFGQLQDLSVSLRHPLLLRQAQDMTGQGTRSLQLREAQDMQRSLLTPLLMLQEQRMLGLQSVPVLLREAQDMTGQGSRSLQLREAQDLQRSLLTPLLMLQEQTFQYDGGSIELIRQKQRMLLVV